MDTVDYIKKEISLNFERKFPKSAKERKVLGNRLAKQMCKGLDAIESLGLKRTYTSVRIDPESITNTYFDACQGSIVSPIGDVVYFIEDIVDGFQARQDFVELNLPFGISQISKQTDLNEEVLQDVFEALLIAAEKYNPYRNISFTTYAGWWVKNAILGYIYRKRYIFKVSPKLTQLANKVNEYIQKTQTKNLPLPSLNELAAHFRQTPSQIIKCLELKPDISLHLNNTTLQDEILDTLEAPISLAKTDELIPYFEKKCKNPLARLYFENILDKIQNEEMLNAEDFAKIEEFLRIKK